MVVKELLGKVDDVILDNILQGTKSLFSGPSLGTEEGVEQILGLTFQRFSCTTFETFPVDF